MAPSGERENWIIWQLSDLHITGVDPAGTPEDSVGVIPPDPGFDYLETLVKCVESRIQDPQWRLRYAPDCVVVCGDLVNLGNQGVPIGKKMARAHSRLQQLKAVLPSEAKFLVVPGNHDLVRKESFPDADVGTKFGSFHAYFKPPDFLTPETGGNPHAAVYFGEVLFCVFNSAAVHGGCLTQDWETLRIALGDDIAGDVKSALAHISHRDAGWIDIEHMRYAERLIAQLGAEESLLRIAVAHHGPGGTGAPELRAFGSICNSGEFIKWLITNRFHLLLHGHRHEAMQACVQQVPPLPPSHPPPAYYRKPWTPFPGVYLVGTSMLSTFPPLGFNILSINKRRSEPRVNVMTFLNEDLAEVKSVYEMPSPAYMGALDRLPGATRGHIGDLLDSLTQIGREEYEFHELLEEDGLLEETLASWAEMLRGFRSVTPVPAKSPVMAAYKSEQLKHLHAALKAHHEDGQGRLIVRMTTYRAMQDLSQEDEAAKSEFLEELREHADELEVRNLVILDATEAEEEDEFLSRVADERKGEPFHLKYISRRGYPKADYHIWGDTSVVCINNVDRASKEDSQPLYVLSLTHRRTVRWFRDMFDDMYDGAKPAGEQPPDGGH